MRTLLGFLLLALLGVTPALAQDAAPPKEGADEKKEITLERLFPEKRFFGASARSISFSHDGRYAAYLWRTWPERRHGYDLWLHDFQSGETRRLTSATVFEPFQRDAKKVADDRREQAKKAAEKKAKAGDGEKDADGEGTGPGEENDERDLGDVVDEDDADREDAPRWGGVASLAWSPVADEMLLVSGGDVYRWKVGGEGLERVTHTRAAEGGVQWLADGSGFLHRQGGALLRVVFGDHRLVQLDPELPGGESLASFALSPDGKKIALLARKGDSSFAGGGRTVKVADYGERFMSVREVPRLVSDDPQPERESILYVYVLPEGMGETGELHRLHRHRHTGPRDQVRTPDWAPDSSRVAFAVFDQENSEVEVFEAILPVEEEPGGSWAELVARAKGAGDEAQDGKTDDGKTDDGDTEKKDDDEEKDEEADAGPAAKAGESEVHELPARVVYKFLHQGGPNTPAMVDPHYAADSRHLVFVTEQSGFRHLGRLDPLYERFEPLTSGPFEVYLEFMPEARDFALVTSTREDPSCQDVYRVDLETGGMTRLTRNTARYSSVGAAADGARLLASREAYGALRELVAIDVAAETEVPLTDSHAPEAKELTAATPEFFEFESRHGFALHGMMFKPEGWKAEDRRPCLIYVYGGPLGTRKEVVQGSYSGSAYLFAWYMAKEHGYVTATIDTRGMSGYGAVFEKANFEQVGKPQVEDLVDGARWLVENAGVDPERIGLHGWSFGGFQTQMCMYTEPEVFACGIAGAGPTEWENYNSWYSTGTIGESRTGTPDLEKYSLLPLAKNLERKLLLVHGMEDSNVLYQDTVRVYAELLKAGKETLVELFLDPSGGHGLGGHVKSLGRYRKYEEFLLRCLGSAEG